MASNNPWNEVLTNIGRNVRFTYYSRHDDARTPNGERSIGDVERVVEGVLSLYRFPNGNVCACVQSENEYPNSPMRGAGGIYYPIVESLSYEGSDFQPESRFDGKRNGSYVVEVL